MKCKSKRIAEIIRSIKSFNLTKYLLGKKEELLENEMDAKDALIKIHEQQIIVDNAHATALESEIAMLKKDIKQLETDVKKVVKVLNLYID